jgi:enamine deaminase RidA (YjgF/YER057c/UK114 family)
VERRTISSGSSYEERYGYSRVVVVGPHVHVAGTAPVMPDNADPPADPYGQMRRCLEIVEAALAQAGAGFTDVVRTRVFLADAAHAPEVMRAHGETFADVRPANTTVVAGMLDPRWHVEIEIDAILPAGP